MAQRKKTGRPPVENPLKDKIYVLVSDETKEKLAKCKEVTNSTTSDIVRKGIDKMYDDLVQK